MNKAMLTGVILAAGITSAQANTELGVQGMFSDHAYGAGDRYDRYIAPEGREESTEEFDDETTPEVPVKKVPTVVVPTPKSPKAEKPTKLPEVIKSDNYILPTKPEVLALLTAPLKPLDSKRVVEYPSADMIQAALKVRQDESKSQWKCLTKAAKAMLSRVEAKWGKLELESTCRPGAVIATSGMPSQHGYGNAIDFIAPKGKKQDVVKWLRKHKAANGIMTYRNMNHIHIDMGKYHFVALNARG